MAGTNVTGDASSAAKEKVSRIERLLKAAVDAESKGDFAGAATLFAEASQYDSKAAADAADLVKSSRAKLDEGNPQAAIEILNVPDPRLRSAQSVVNLLAEITDLKSRVPTYNIMGSNALQRKAYDEAKVNFLSSARGGAAEGMLHLGDLYKNGLGVPADQGLAKVWWQRAADAGNAEAIERLRSRAPISNHKFDAGHSG